MKARLPWIERPGRVAGAVFVTALLVRLVYLWEGSKSPAFAAPVVDSDTYDRLASAFAAGSGLTVEFFWQPLLYPLFLSAVYVVGNSSMLVARLLQLVLGAATCALTYRLGRNVFDRPSGAVAGTITAFYGPLIFFDLELLAAGWACFWSVVLLLALLWARRVRSGPACFAWGACAALAVLTRPTFLPFVVAAGLWLVGSMWRAGADRRRLAAVAGLVLAGFALPALPAALASRTHSGRLSILPASGGINLYIGNNAQADRTVAIRPGWHWQQLTRLPERAGVVHKKDTSRYFRGEFADYVRNDPAGFLRGLGAKTGQFASSRELPRNVDVYVQREWSQVLAFTTWKAGSIGFPFGLLLPLALCGLIMRCRQVPVPILLFLLLYPAAVVFVFVSARYRAPVVPVLAVVAGAGAVALLRAMRERRFDRLALAAGLVAVALAASGLPGPFPQESTDHRAELDYLVGSRALNQGDLDHAVLLLGQALERVPEHIEAHNMLGLAHYRQGRPDLAVRHFERALAHEPGFVTARDNLAGTLAHMGDLDGALREFRTAIEQAPYDADLHVRCSRVLAARRDYAAALQHLERALELGPDDADIAGELDRVRHAAGQGAQTE